MEQSKFYQIKNITEHEYTLVGCNGIVITCPIQDVDKSASAFTIKDAKDGDVLAVDSSSICIFDGTVEEGMYPFAYCGLTRHHGFEVYNRKLPFTHDKDIHPATKEQRDLLFSKMKEAGYEWNAEKKELKKIELTDFESALFSAFSDAWQEYLSGKEVNVAKWTKEHSAELLEIAREQKPAWNEEDEEMFDSVIADIQFTQKAHTHEVNHVVYEREIDWLKSLKERMKGE